MVVRERESFDIGEKENTAHMRCNRKERKINNFNAREKEREIW
jgi:hypothetical protein